MPCSTAISLDARKLVHVRCCADLGNGVIIVVRDQGPGFDPSRVANPLASENLAAGRGRRIRLRTLAIDEVRFERKGTEIHLHKAPERKAPPDHQPRSAISQWLVRPLLGLLVVE